MRVPIRNVTSCEPDIAMPPTSVVAPGPMHRFISPHTELIRPNCAMIANTHT